MYKGCSLFPYPPYTMYFVKQKSLIGSFITEETIDLREIQSKATVLI